MSQKLMVVLAACLLVAGMAHAESWPRIQPFDRLYNFGRPQDMYLSLPILAVNGKSAYTFAPVLKVFTTPASSSAAFRFPERRRLPISSC